MSSSKYIIGILGLLLLSSIASAYTNDSTAFYCTNCTDCTAALNNNTYNITYLNGTISGAAGTCINSPANISGKTFDCQNHQYDMSGTGTGAGFFLATGDTNVTIRGCDISGFLRGISITDNSPNNTVENCITHNNTETGTFVDSSNNCTVLDSVSYNNTLYGFRVRTSDDTRFDNATAYDNGNYGFYLYNADRTYVTNSVTHHNYDGAYIYSLAPADSLNNTFHNVYSYNNSGSGFNLTGTNTVRTVFSNCTATNNTADGFTISDGDYNTINYSVANLNGRDGIRFTNTGVIQSGAVNVRAYSNGGIGINFMEGSANDAVYNSSVYLNGNHGISLTTADDNFIMYADVYDNGGNGIHLYDSKRNYIYRSTIHSNANGTQLTGLACSNSIDNQFVNNSIYGNTQRGITIYGHQNNLTNTTIADNAGWGFFTSMCDDNIIRGGSLYNNAGGGINVESGSFNNFSSLVMYNNSASGSTNVVVDGGTLDNRFDNILIYNDSAYIYHDDVPPSTFTNLTIGYNSTVGLVNWIPQLLVNNTNLNYLNFLVYPDFVSLNDSNATAFNTSANITLNVSSCTPTRVVYRKTGFPSTRADIVANGSVYNTSLTCTSNVATFNVSGFSGYAADPPVSTCMVINSSGLYTLTNNLTGAPINASPLLDYVCIKIAASDVELDCAGYNITNNGTGGTTYGILLNGSITNVTVRNCPSVSQYSYGIYIYQSNDTLFTNDTVNSNVLGGFVFYNVSNATVAGSGAYNTYEGFRLYNSSACNLIDNIAYDNGNFGFKISAGSNHLLVNNTAYNNSNQGFHITDASLNNILINNTARDSPFEGFRLDQDSNNATLMDNSAYNNNRGFYLSPSSNGTYINNTAYNNSFEGFRVFASSGNNYTNNRAYDNYEGFYLYGGSDHNVLTDNSAYNNSHYGFFLGTSSNNTLNNCASYDNDYGYYLDTVTNTNLTDNVARDNTVDGFRISSSTDSILLDCLSYNNTERGFIVTAASHRTVFNNASAMDNLLDGFFLANSQNLTIANSTSYSNNGYGFQLSNADSTIINVEAYGNPNGIVLGNSVINATDLHLYGNSVDELSVVAGPTASFTVNITNATIDNPAGNFENYTSLVINDNQPVVGSTTAFSVKWTAEPATPPLTHFSFEQKYIHIDVTGTPSIDMIRWTWLDSEVSPPYDDSKFELWRYVSTDGGIWSNVSGQTLDTTNNYIELLAFSPSSDYGILQNNNTPPSLTIESPLNNTAYSVNTVDLNYTVSDADNITCWYDLDGTGYIQLSNCTNTTLPGLSDGPHNVTVLVNDTLNAQNSSTVYFTIDTTPPTVSIQSPQNTTYNTSTPDLNYTAGDNVGIDSCWYYLDGAGPTALVGCANVTPLPALGDGPHNITVFVNDTANNTASDTVYFVTDATPPTVTIDSPTNTTYNTTNDVDLNYTAGDNIGLDSCWYYLNGAGPTPLPGCTNITLVSLPNGPYNLTVIVNDTAGNTGQDNVSFTVDVPAPPPSGGGRPRPSCTDASVTLTYVQCPENKLLFTAVNKDTGAPAVDARIVIKGPWPWSDVKYSGSDGTVEFLLPVDGTYQVFADGGRTEDYCSDILELDYTLCPEDACYRDDDCADTEYCNLTDTTIPGECLPVPCECGEVYDHRCHPYECCADADCERGYVCEDHECVYQPECESDAQCAEREYCSDGACIPIETGECGFVENHTWFDYECCKDEDCPPGLLCFQHFCKLYKIETNETGYVGDRHGVQVYPEGQYDLTMTDPDGRQFTVATNENGYATFVLEIEGDYGVALVEDNESLATVDVKSLKRPLPPEEERPLIWLEELLKFFWWLLILLLLIIGYLLFRRRKKKRYRAGE